MNFPNKKEESGLAYLLSAQKLWAVESRFKVTPFILLGMEELYVCYKIFKYVCVHLCVQAFC